MVLFWTKLQKIVHNLQIKLNYSVLLLISSEHMTEYYNVHFSVYFIIMKIAWALEFSILHEIRWTNQSLCNAVKGINMKINLNVY